LGLSAIADDVELGYSQRNTFAEIAVKRRNVTVSAASYVPTAVNPSTQDDCGLFLNAALECFPWPL